MSRIRQSCTPAILLAIVLSLLVLGLTGVRHSRAGDALVTTVTVEARFTDVLDSVKSAIVGRGINVAHILPASEMLNRTAGAFGVKENIFIEAQTVEFCSAKISHHLVRANPENIVLCPFTISIYVLAKDPDHVRVSYRRPFVIDPESAPAAQEIVELVSGIVEEAVAW